MPPLSDKNQLLTTIDSPTATTVSRKFPRSSSMLSPDSQRQRTLSGESTITLPPSMPCSPSSSRGRVSPSPKLTRQTSIQSVPDRFDVNENDPQGSNRPRCKSLATALDLQANKKGPTLEVQLRQSVEQYGEYHPMTSKLFNKMGNVHFRKGDFAMAESYYSKAAYCESEQHVAFLNLGTVYWRTHQLDKAIEYLKRAKRGNNDALAKASVYHQLGLCYALLREYQNALLALTKAYNIRTRCHGDSHPSVAKTMEAIGNVHSMQAERDEAVYHYTGP